MTAIMLDKEDITFSERACVIALIQDDDEYIVLFTTKEGELIYEKEFDDYDEANAEFYRISLDPARFI